MKDPLINSIASEMSKLVEILERKEELILEQKLIDCNIDLNTIRTPCRFPRIHCESHPDGVKKYYFNDGTPDGRLIFTTKTVVGFDEEELKKGKYILKTEVTYS